MIPMFLIIIGGVGGFALCIVAYSWLRGCENRQIARVAREKVRKKR